MSGSGGGGFGSEDGLLSSDGVRHGSPSPSLPGREALLFRNGVAASIGGKTREKTAATATATATETETATETATETETETETETATATAAAVSARDSSSASSLSPSSSSSSFFPCSGAFMAPRHGLWALQALAVDAAGNEGEPAACALSFEGRPTNGLNLNTEALAAIAVGALVVVVAGGWVVACWVRRRGRR